MSMVKWVVGGLPLGGSLILATKASADTGPGENLSYMGVPFTVEPEKTYWKFTFEYGGETYGSLDQKSREEAIASAQTMIETLKGGA